MILDHRLSGAEHGGFQLGIDHLQSKSMIEPMLGRDVFIAPSAYVSGDVTIGDQATIMHQAVVRGDIAPIRIGSRVNIQDGTILHTPHGTPLDIAADVGIGRRAVVYCRRIGRRTLIGIGAILLDNGEVGSGCIVAAGTVLAPGTIVPDGSVVMGVPGRIARQVDDRDLETIDHVVQSYIEIGRLHAMGRYPNTSHS